MNRLNSRIAIVTGGALGIGRACVERMAEEGAKVAVFDILTTEGEALAAKLAAKGHEVAFWRVDVADEGALTAEGGEGCYRIGSPGRTYGRARRHRLGSGLAGPGRGKVRHRGRTGGGRRLCGAMT